MDTGNIVIVVVDDDDADDDSAFGSFQSGWGIKLQ